MRNWVEPDPVPFQRLSAMAGLTRDGLASPRACCDRDLRKLLTDYIRLVDRLATLAADELAGRPISDKDNEWLRAIGGVLEGFWWRSGDRLDSAQPIRDDDAAIIADIMRGIDLEAGIDEVLEIGTGRIDRIFVLVPDDAGDFHVATGGVYSYYEFPWPTEDRLTDEQWWEMLRAARRPTDRPGRSRSSRSSRSPTWRLDVFVDRHPEAESAGQRRAFLGADCQSIEHPAAEAGGLAEAVSPRGCSVASDRAVLCLARRDPNPPARPPAAASLRCRR